VQAVSTLAEILIDKSNLEFETLKWFWWLRQKPRKL